MSSRFSLSYSKHTLLFKQPSGTSRGILTEKKCWILELKDEETGLTGKGECSVIEGLSPDFSTDSLYEEKLNDLQQKIDFYIEHPIKLNNFPSILMGLEMCIFDIVNGGRQIYFPSAFTKGEKHIPINGLVWMGDAQFMQDQVNTKLEQGFSCIKMKVGAIDFDQELRILEQIRNRFSADQITLRVDANGSFTPDDVLYKLEQLAQFDLHSIEQPIMAGQRDAMHELCKATPLPIALDEELIGINLRKEKEQLLDEIQPQYIILKPSLHGGFIGSQEWIRLANERNIGWWITSALESNIGLNAIAQFAGILDVKMPQGLGTGGLFVSNFESPLSIEMGELKYSI
jgi:o-succinylbenzoate synthase